MANFCIICEFNPLHSGHQYLLQEARRMGAQTVTCIMSGNSTQRGELAVVDKYARAEAAIKCGADLVLELPYPWSSSSADFFANAGVSIAAEYGDVLLFGSESGDVGYLGDAAEFCESESFSRLYEEYTDGGMGSAAAYALALSKKGFDKISSNDLLGIAYIRAIKRQGADITPITVQRIGAAYNRTEIGEEEHPSATALRELISNGDTARLERHMPPAMLQIILDEAKNGRLTDMEEASGAILGYLRLCAPDALEGIADTEGGLSNRIVSAAKRCSSYKELTEALKTKRYTDAKLRRALLFSLTSVKGELLRERPQYSLLLGANEKGRQLLSQKRRTQGVRIVTKPADAPVGSAQQLATERLDSLFGLARRSKMTSEDFVRKKTYIVK